MTAVGFPPTGVAQNGRCVTVPKSCLPAAASVAVAATTVAARAGTATTSITACRWGAGIRPNVKTSFQYFAQTASIATRSAASGSAGVTVLVGVAVAVEDAAALRRVALGAGDIAAGELAGDVGVERPVEVTAGEDCGAREADATGAADEVDVARGGGSCRCTPEGLLEHPVTTAVLSATTARMVTRTTRLMLSTSSHEHVYWVAA